MIANNWYCIAETSVFDSDCSIYISFDGYSVQFYINVRYGFSSINVGYCNIPSNITFSVRLRENNNQWFVDILCNKEINPNINITDSQFWVSSSSQSNTGNVLISLLDISNEFNTTGGEGNLDTEELDKYLSSNGYTTEAWVESQEYLKEHQDISHLLSKTDATDTYATIESLNNTSQIITNIGIILNDWFTLEEVGGEKVLKTKYNLASEKAISWRGVSTSGGGTSGGGLIQRVYGYDNITDVFDDNTKTDTFNAYTIAKIAERVSNIEKNGVGEDVDLTGYATEDWVLSKDYATNTAVANLQLAHNSLRSEFDALNNVLNDDVSGKINTWNEVVDFLDEYSGSQDLATILAGINGDISTLQGKFTKDNIQTTLGIADWALAASKPSYAFSEITGKPTTLAGYGITDALSINGGTINGSYNPLTLKSNDASLCQLTLYTNNKLRGIFQYNSNFGVGFNNSSVGGLYITNNSLPTYVDASNNVYILLHANNYHNFALPIKGGNIQGDITFGAPYSVVKNIAFNSTSGWARQMVKLTVDDKYVAALGAFGDYTYGSEENTAAMIYLGFGAYNGTNLKIYPTYAAWGNNPILHVGNYTDYTYSQATINSKLADYLPKSGGTLTNTDSTVLKVNSSATSTYIQFMKDGSSIGYFGYVGSEPYTYYGGFQKIIHAGNIASQSVAYANNAGTVGGETQEWIRKNVIAFNTASSYDANTELYSAIVNYGDYGYWLNAPTGMKYGQVMNFNTKFNYLIGQLAWDINHNGEDTTRNLWWRAVSKPEKATNAQWHQIAFTDSNVASATKLATARTIWGQSFDGSGDVNGDLKIGNSNILDGNNRRIVYSSGTDLYFGTSDVGIYNTYLSGNSVALRYGEGVPIGLLLNNKGNVLIGTTTDRGHKLTINSRPSEALTSTTLNNSSLFIGLSNTLDSHGMNLWTEGNGTGFIQQGRTDEEQPKLYNLSLQPFGGNVLIGTTTDDGVNKLQVGGNIYMSGVLYGTRRLHRTSTALYGIFFDSRDFNSALDASDIVIYSKQATVLSGGNVLIGTVTNNGNKLQVNGNISATGSISWGAASDRRLKDNIKTISSEDAINVIMALNPVTFEWNKTATEKDNSLKGLSSGFIADEYTKVIPNSSRPIWEEYTAIDYKLTAAFVVKGLQNHEERLRVLERENRELKNELNKLRGYGN